MRDWKKSFAGRAALSELNPECEALSDQTDEEAGNILDNFDVFSFLERGVISLLGKISPFHTDSIEE